MPDLLQGEHATNANFMKTETNHDIKKSTSEKPGFFARLLGRIDRAMKNAAEKRASGCCCCSTGDKTDKGGKCC